MAVVCFDIRLIFKDVGLETSRLTGHGAGFVTGYGESTGRGRGESPGGWQEVLGGNGNQVI